MNNKKKNDKDREDFVINEEGLNAWYESTGLALNSFVRKFRKEIDMSIPKREEESNV